MPYKTLTVEKPRNSLMGGFGSVFGERVCIPWAFDALISLAKVLFLVMSVNLALKPLFVAVSS